MNTRKICVSLGEKNSEELYSSLEKIEGADCIEVRLDYSGQLDIKTCFTKTDIDLLFTCRASWEGGFYEGDEEDRIQLFKECLDLGASFVDLELASPKTSINDLLEHRKIIDSQTQLILSHHDFSATQGLEALKSIVDEMKDAGADIGKLITTASNSSDMLIIFTILEYAKMLKFPLIAFCMGAEGVMSRVACCDFGSYMTYCAVDGKPVTASGQLKVSGMIDVFGNLS
ncbi:MAG: type I 3-dehydroquinate dehydratase [Desulfotalea sp.]